MSLQVINEELEVDLVEREPPKVSPMRGAFQRLRTNSLGTRFKGEYPTSCRLEELLLGIE